jgi:hypothetical protein
MSKSRILNAGGAGSLGYNTNVNVNTAGGTKKQGLPFTLGSPRYNLRDVKRQATGISRHIIFTMNQVGGANRTNHFNGNGIHKQAPYVFK